MASRSAHQPLTASELDRYRRHLAIPEFSLAAQTRLKAGKVLLVGAGGLGSSAAIYLAAVGVGTLGLVEFDRVELPNLQRQVLYGDADLGRPKLEAAVERLAKLNPHVAIVPHPVRLDAANAAAIVGAYDVVVDGSDNFATRYLVNDACVLLGKPDVYGSVLRFEGQVSVFAVRGGPCYRCLYPEPPAAGSVPDCAQGGVLGVLPGLVGVLQATEVVKLLTGIGQPLSGRVLLVDALAMHFRELRLCRDAACPLCGDHPTITRLTATAVACAAPSGLPAELTPTELKARLARGADLVLLDVREEDERRVSNLGGVWIPLGDLAARLDELDRTRELVVYCRSGGRSARAVALLRKRGFTAVSNLAGGLLRWAADIDPDLPVA